MAFLAPLWNERLGYTGMNDRQLMAAIMRPGVFATGDLLCAAGTGFTSSIAGGRGAVEGNFQAQQGIYVVQNTGPVSITHPNPNASNPRIDTIGVKVFDSTDGGDASDGTQPMVLEGTPTAGNTLAKAEGLAALPKNFLELFRVLVPTAAGSAASFIYEDRRVSAALGAISAKSIIVAEQERTNAVYGTLPTPDEVTVVLSENGLIAIAYQAAWACTSNGTIRAAIFLGVNQLKAAGGTTPAVVQAKATFTGSSNFFPLSSCPMGLTTLVAGPEGAYGGDVTTGQIVGQSPEAPGGNGICYVFAVAGTYKISVQFRAEVGSVKVKNRKLWAWVVG